MPVYRGIQTTWIQGSGGNFQFAFPSVARQDVARQTTCQRQGVFGRGRLKSNIAQLRMGIARVFGNQNRFAVRGFFARHCSFGSALF